MKSLFYFIKGLYEFLILIYAICLLLIDDYITRIKAYFIGERQYVSFIQGTDEHMAYEQYEGLCNKAGIDKKYNINM